MLFRAKSFPRYVCQRTPLWDVILSLLSVVTIRFLPRDLWSESAIPTKLLRNFISANMDLYSGSCSCGLLGKFHNGLHHYTEIKSI